MLTQFTATVVDGMLRPDEPIGLPNESRVNVLIAPFTASTSELDRVSGWEGMQKLIRERPINSGGLRFTRDELYDRD